MSNRELAKNLIDKIPENRLFYVISYLQGAAVPDEPNEATYAAMEAADMGEDVYGPFDSVSALMEALNA